MLELYLENKKSVYLFARVISYCNFMCVEVVRSMNEINSKIGNSSLSFHNVTENNSRMVGDNKQVDSTNSSINSSNRNRLRTQESLASAYQQALASVDSNATQAEATNSNETQTKPSNSNGAQAKPANSNETQTEQNVDENQIKSKLEELKNRIIEILQAAADKVSSIDQAKKLNKLLDLMRNGVHIDQIIQGIDSLRESFPDLANRIIEVMKRYNEINGYINKVKGIAKNAAKLVEGLSERLPSIKNLLDSKVSKILKNMGSSILSKLGPFAKIIGYIGTAVEVVLAVKKAVDILMSDKSIEEKGIELADLIIRKALGIGGVYVFMAIGSAIGGPIGGAIGGIAGGIVGLVGGYDFLADKLKEVGATKVFAEWVIIPVLKLFEKPSLATNNV